MNLRFKDRKVFTLISFGFFVHALILKAAFDIYFSSPIDHGMTPIKSTKKPLAKRLILIVADGLRAEAIFGENQNETAPNLDKISKTRGSWGVSHTRVPTESRPGHVALLGGIYEDPSAVLKGWKVNPVDFDSVINQSTNAWCWGGPSVINMFNKDNLSHIHLHSFDHSMEDFGSKNAIALDAWVFEHVEAFIANNKNSKEFAKPGNLFFLHLLGLDTAGHGFKPNSDAYKGNIKFVDENVVKIEKLFERTFPDKSTAYVFTGDHGMTNWGSHGAGSDHETQTPLIAWGSGIKIEKKRKDVKQIDVAPLLSALIGINYPINSLGRLPYDYLDTSVPHLSEIIISNVLQLTETFNIKRHRRMSNAIRFVPFQGVTTEDLNRRLFAFKRLSDSQLKVESGDFIEFLIKGADYYHNYYQLPLLISLSVGIVAWIIYLATFNVSVESRKSNYVEICVFGVLYLFTLCLLKIQSLPVMYYLYFIFPIFMVHIVTSRYRYALEALKQVRNFGFTNALSHFFVYLVGLRLLVQGFHYRETISIVMYLMAIFVFYSKPLRTCTSKKEKAIWVGSCGALSCFPFLPVMKTTFNITTYLSGYALGCIAIQKLILTKLEANRAINVQQLMFKVTPLYTLAVEFDFVGAQSPLKYLSWIWAFLPILLVPFSSTHIFPRISSIVIGFGTFYLMVTSNFENLFLFCYIFLLYVWLLMESRLFGFTVSRVSFDGITNEDQEQTSDDFRRAFFFVVLIFVGFFGTGSIASLNSFDPMWVRCFLTVFSPFKMAGVILLRIMVPFIFTSCVYRAVNLFRKGNTLNMFCIVLMFSDLMLLELLFYITNVGSWLEIGMSLSQFIIMEAFVIILLLLYGFAYLLTTMTYGLTFFNK